jgi:hypothetical protein
MKSNLNDNYKSSASFFTILSGIQVTTNNPLSFKQSRLDVKNITRDSPTTFRCQTTLNQETISETISFQISGINRYKLFVNFNFIKLAEFWAYTAEVNDSTTIPVAITVVFLILFVIGIGIGIKFYLYQV